jgi:hypothetical protein
MCFVRTTIIAITLSCMVGIGVVIVVILATTTDKFDHHGANGGQTPLSQKPRLLDPRW